MVDMPLLSPKLYLSCEVYHNLRPISLRREAIDTLTISALQVKTRIGVYAWEQHILQPLLLDLVISLDLRACQDMLANTLDYADICANITDLIESKSFTLIETVAEEVAVFLKAKYANITALKISVSKPKAVKNAGNVTITIER